MYLSHFGLIEQPFGITPDTAYTYTDTSYLEAFNTLLIGLQSGEGFIKITGEVGTGKTLLCRSFLAALGKDYFSAYLPNPAMPPFPLLLAVADELGLKHESHDQQFHLIKQINQRLLELASEGKTVVFCVDEAQTAPLDSLEALRMLSNLETEKTKLMHLVLFGQPELNTHLADPSVRQLLQRIAFHYHLQGLRKEELGHYLNHRLRVAGYRGGQLFSDRAQSRLYCYTKGIPRLVNILANKAMIAAYGQGKPIVEGQHVKAAARDTEAVNVGLW